MSIAPPEQKRFADLLDEGEYQLGPRAQREGKRDLKAHFKRDPTDSEIVQYIIDALQCGKFCLVRTPQGEPPGSDVEAWQFTDSNQIFIKLRFHEPKFGKLIVYVKSCHKSVHA